MTRQYFFSRLYVTEMTKCNSDEAAFYLSHRNPLVFDDIIDVVPFGRIRLEHSLDQVFGVLGDVGPLGLGELVLPRTDSLLHPGRNRKAVVAVKWRESAKSGRKGGQNKITIMG